MKNYIPSAQPTQPANPATDTDTDTLPMIPATPPSERAADILLQELKLLLDQSRQTCDPDNAVNLGPNEKSRILCAMAEAITAGAQTIAELEKANNDVHAITLKVVGKEAFMTDIREMTEVVQELSNKREKAGTSMNDISTR